MIVSLIVFDNHYVYCYIGFPIAVLHDTLPVRSIPNFRSRRVVRLPWLLIDSDRSCVSVSDLLFVRVNHEIQDKFTETSETYPLLFMIYCNITSFVRDACSFMTHKKYRYHKNVNCWSSYLISNTNE